MSEDSPKIVGLETSLELSEFLSETESPSETDVPLEAEPLSQSGSPAVAASAPGGDVVRVEPLPFASAAFETPAVNTSGIPADSVRQEPVPPNAHAGPATVTEFPVRQQTPSAVALPLLPFLAPGPVALVDLIERHGGFDWREAVAVIHQICQYLKEHPPHPPILLDPRNIQITDRGEVHLLSGQTSSDPLVIQVGRLLRTMLMGKEAPPELRLLLAQATFELPIFESIEDVDRALAQLGKLDEPGPAGLALLRAVAAPPPPPDADGLAYRPPAVRSILPKERAAARKTHRKTPQIWSLLSGYALHVAIILVGIAALGALLLTRSSLLFSADKPSPKPAPSAIVATSATTGTTPPEVAAPERTSAPPALVPLERAVASPTDRRPSPVAPPPAQPDRERASMPAAPVDSRTATANPRRPVSNTARPAATAGSVVTPPSLRDSERRATSLLAQGQTAEASMAFDSLVLSNPLYEPRATDLTPEALAAFRTSQRQLLPVIAQRNYDRGKAALAAGDADRALSLGKEAAVIMERRLADTPPQLREQVADLVEQATTAAAAANEIIYTEADAGVIPPRPLSRQMPVSSPVDVPPNRVGWLDMVIGTDGSVYSVKLHTPLNRHHERMIVSPAKAWRYRPAMKNGRPVMYRIMVKVNLPESGTEY
jgi:hypothetical protein